MATFPYARKVFRTGNLELEFPQAIDTTDYIMRELVAAWYLQHRTTLGEVAVELYRLEVEARDITTEPVTGDEIRAYEVARKMLELAEQSQEWDDALTKWLFHYKDKTQALTVYSPMELYNLWTVIAGGVPTDTTWETTGNTLTQHSSTTDWALVGWAPLFEFQDGAITGKLTYVEQADLPLGSAPVGMRVNTAGDGIFWKTNNGQLELIEREANVRTVLYTQAAPALGTTVYFELVDDQVELQLDGVVVHQGTVTRLEQGFGAVFLGEISESDVVLVEDLSIQSGGFYSPIETHPSYELLAGGAERSRFEYNDISGDLWLSGGTSPETVVYNVDIGITQTANFYGYIDYVAPNTSFSSFTAAMQITDVNNFVGLRTYNNLLQVFSREGLNNWNVLYQAPATKGDYVELLCNQGVVTIIHNGAVTFAQSANIEGYVGVINRGTQSGGRQRYWTDWFISDDDLRSYDPLEDSPVWAALEGTVESSLSAVGNIIYVDSNRSGDDLLYRTDIPEIQDGQVEVIWRVPFVPDNGGHQGHLVMRATAVDRWIGVRAHGARLQVFDRNPIGWALLAQLTPPVDGDIIRLIASGDQLTVEIERPDGTLRANGTYTLPNPVQAGRIGICNRGASANWWGKQLWSNLEYTSFDYVPKALTTDSGEYLTDEVGVVLQHDLDTDDPMKLSDFLVNDTIRFDRSLVNSSNLLDIATVTLPASTEVGRYRWETAFSSTSPDTNDSLYWTINSNVIDPQGVQFSKESRDVTDVDDNTYFYEFDHTGGEITVTLQSRKEDSSASNIYLTGSMYLKRVG